MTYIRCPHCGAKALNVATMCPQCREPLSQNPMEAGPHGLEACHRCGKFIERDAEVCPFCGYQVRRGRALRRWVGGSLLALVLVGGLGWGFWAAGGIPGIAGWFRDTNATTAASAPPRPAPVIPAPVDPALPVDTAPPRAEPMAAAAPPRPAPAPIVLPPLVTRYARNWANVRAGRSTDSSVVAILRPGDRIQVGEFVSGWWAVWSDSARVGFVATDLLSATPVDSLP